MRRVFVVGAAGGLGHAVAKAFGERQAALALFARNQDALERRVAELTRDGVKPVSFVADTADETQLIAALEQAREQLGGVDVVVNCSGWSPPLAPLVLTTTADWEKAMLANARPSFLILRWALRVMGEAGAGDVVDVCTAVLGARPAKVVGYRAAKAAQLSVGAVARAEAKGSGVRVVSVLPEPMDTPMRWAITPNFPRDAVLPADAVAQAIVALTELPRAVAVDEVFLRVP
jgi:NAD(P)-dependent dehydrogenase (short-subunit alcohol dehydrogenase family)